MGCTESKQTAKSVHLNKKSFDTSKASGSKKEDNKQETIEKRSEKAVENSPEKAPVLDDAVHAEPDKDLLKFQKMRKMPTFTLSEVVQGADEEVVHVDNV